MPLRSGSPFLNVGFFSGLQVEAEAGIEAGEEGRAELLAHRVVNDLVAAELARLHRGLEAGGEIALREQAEVIGAGPVHHVEQPIAQAHRLLLAPGSPRARR